jgi:predicted GH43/DUF377 family glycosyl hydrolase
MRAIRSGVIIKPDPNRVFFQQLRPSTEKRGIKIIGRIMALSESEVDAQLNNVLHEFNDRHLHLLDFFLERFEQSRKYLFTDQSLSENRKLLIGAYFTQEYSLESAALFNPSMVWHPDQSSLRPGSKRFIISLRATGEGHISSIVFRSGVINSHTKITIDPISPFVTAPDIEPNPSYQRTLFRRTLFELGIAGEFVDRIVASLDESFTFGELETQVRTSLRIERKRGNDCQTLAQGVLSLAESNYEVQFSEGRRLSERVIFPSTPAEVKGIEDARFVEFTGDDQSRVFYATYTAYDGQVIIPQLLETRDFLRFKISTLNGPEVHNKGLALFPRQLNGLYAMISRQDNENIYLMFSDNVRFWYTKRILLKPTYSWEFIQLGNCGSPIETEAGWLVLGHGVGPMRKYSIGAFLLDRDDPARVIGRLKEPLLSPDENEREGYVPNVVYSCGGQVHGDQLIIPYAMADYASSFATVKLSELLDELVRNPA